MDSSMLAAQMAHAYDCGAEHVSCSLSVVRGQWSVVFFSRFVSEFDFDDTRPLDSVEVRPNRQQNVD